MHSAPQMSLHEIGPPFSSSGDAIIHRLCTDHLIRCRIADKSPSRPGIKILHANVGWKSRAISHVNGITASRGGKLFDFFSNAALVEDVFHETDCIKYLNGD